MDEKILPPSEILDYLRRAIPEGSGDWTVIEDRAAGRKFAVISWPAFVNLGKIAGIRFVIAND